MLATFDNAGDIVPASLTDLFSPLQELTRVPVRLVAMFAGQMVFVGGVFVREPVTVMYRNKSGNSA